MSNLLHDPRIVGRTIRFGGHEGTVMAIIPPLADIRDYLGRDIETDDAATVIYTPLQARVRSEAARLLVRTADGKFFAPRRTVLGRKENR